MLQWEVAATGLIPVAAFPLEMKKCMEEYFCSRRTNLLEWKENGVTNVRIQGQDESPRMSEVQWQVLGWSQFAVMIC